MKVIHLLCALNSAHSLCMLKNVSVFPCVNVDVRRMSDQRHSKIRHKWSTPSKFVVFLMTEVCLSHTYMTHGPPMTKIKK